MPSMEGVRQGENDERLNCMSKQTSASARKAAKKAIALAIGKVIAAKRVSAEMSQEELAERIDSTRSYVSDLERGVKEPCLGMIMRLAKAFDQTASEFLHGIDQKVI